MKKKTKEAILKFVKKLINYKDDFTVTENIVLKHQEIDFELVRVSISAMDYEDTFIKGMENSNYSAHVMVTEKLLDIITRSGYIEYINDEDIHSREKTLTARIFIGKPKK